MKLLLSLMLLTGSAQAYSLHYKVAKPDAAAITARLESSTGLTFEAKCGTCTVNGHITTISGSVEVVVYQTKGVRYLATKSVSADLKKKIGKAVLNLK